MPDIPQLIAAAASLATDGEDTNPEYDRALVELVGQFLPGDGDNVKVYLYPLITGKDAPL